jgi:secreted Zn-dependent insulinase-like peptidase
VAFRAAPLGDARNAPLIQVFFAGQLTDEEILAKFEGFAAIMRAILAQYEQIPAQIIPYQQEISSPREHFFWLLTLDNGIRSMRASLAWAENVIEQLKQGNVPANKEKNMNKILVTYATNSGSTAEVAKAVMEEIQKSGAQVELCPSPKSGNSPPIRRLCWARR